jgi:hypothetical protein
MQEWDLFLLDPFIIYPSSLTTLECITLSLENQLKGLMYSKYLIEFNSSIFEYSHVGIANHYIPEGRVHSYQVRLGRFSSLTPKQALHLTTQYDESGE